MNPKTMQGPFNFDQREVFFDSDKGEFWDPLNHHYLNHEIGLALIDLYFGHHKAPLAVKNDSTKVKKKLLKKIKKSSSNKNSDEWKH
jgi:hypothetical protein